MDKIILEGMQFYGYHGLFPEENRLGQRFNVDLELYTDTSKAGRTDDMNDSIHYGHAYEIVKQIVEQEIVNLIETVAERIAAALLEHFDELQACRVKVIKPDAPIPGHFKFVAVEIYREK
ncbi:dihydroneopterin aldolase [Aciduricibacillus chroicocephali]|uniref:7,8-dihydroneopterin aldolase n=1 Tax=Aciduricibacillus chroicocephali TaxID=3054939 RepID=A0ABY9KVC4_9BACI|nr:dihydroneopterin aldolase [Bacillaceae bacterium 44XB]